MFRRFIVYTFYITTFGILGLFHGDINKVLLTGLLCICCCKDALRGEVPFKWSISFFMAVLLDNLYNHEIMKLGIGIICFLMLLLLHQQDDKNGEPVIGGADVFVIPASMIIYDSLPSMYGTLIGMLIAALIGTIQKQYKVRLLSFIPVGLALISMIDFRFLELFK